MFKKIVLLSITGLVVTIGKTAYAAQEPKSNPVTAAVQSIALVASDKKPLDCVTHIPEIQKIIADYCDQEWVPGTELAAKHITAFACSSDGRYMAYALAKNYDGPLLNYGAYKKIGQDNVEIEIWDEHKKSAVQFLLPITHGDRIQLAFVPKSSYLAVASNHVWYLDLNTKNITEMGINGKPWHPRQIADCDDVDTYRNHYKQRYLAVYNLTFSSDGEYFSEGLGNIHDKNGSCVYEVDRFNMSERVRLFSSDCTKVLCAQMQSRLVVTDFKKKQWWEFGLSGLACTVVWAMIPKSNCVAIVAGNLRNGITIQDFVTGATVLYDKIGHAIDALAAVSEKYIVAGTEKGEIIIFDISSFQEDVKTGIAMPAKTFCSLDTSRACSAAADSGHVKSLHSSTNGKYLTAEYQNGLIKRWINLAHYLLEKYKS